MNPPTQDTPRHTAGQVYSGLTNICATTGTTAVSFGVAGKEIGAMNMEHLTAESDAARLAHCWNMHSELVAALEAIAELGNDSEHQVFKLTRFQAAQVARAALNKSKSQ